MLSAVALLYKRLFAKLAGIPFLSIVDADVVLEVVDLWKVLLADLAHQPLLVAHRFLVQGQHSQVVALVLHYLLGLLLGNRFGRSLQVHTVARDSW